MIAHLRIPEHNQSVISPLRGRPGGLANRSLKDKSSGVVHIAAHQIEATGRAAYTNREFRGQIVARSPQAGYFCFELRHATSRMLSMTRSEEHTSELQSPDHLLYR